MSQWLMAALAALIVLAVSGPASAQLLTETTGWGIRNKGPGGAKGAIYFIKGYGGGTRADWNLVPHFLLSLNASGWDVIVDRTNPDHQPDRSVRWPQRRRNEIAHAIREAQRRIPAIRRKGYRTVIGAGHSFGAWTLTEIATRQPEAVNGLILTAPSAHSRRLTGKGKRNDLFYELTGASKDRFRRLETPTFVAMFKGDEYEPPRRAQAVKALAGANKALYVVSEPAAFSGHFAGWTPVFDYLYGDCLARIAIGQDLAGCARDAVGGDDWRAVVAYELVAKDKRGVVPSDSLKGQSFVRYGLGQSNMHMAIGDDGTRARLLYASERRRGQLKLTAAAGGEGSRVCVDRECGRLVRWSDRVLLEFDEKGGGLRYWWVAIE